MVTGTINGMSPLRTTTRSHLQCFVRHIHYNNFIKFNVHIDSKVMGYRRSRN